MKVLVRQLVVGLWVVGATLAWAQGAPTQQSIEAKLQAPFLMLRGMWDCNSLHFDTQGSVIGACDVGPFSTSALVVKRIRLSDRNLEIKGSRAGLQFGRSTAVDSPIPVSAVNLDRMTVSIERDPQNPQALDAAIDRIFAKDFDDALADSAPLWWQPWLRHQAHPDAVPAPGSFKGQQSLVTHPTGKAGEISAPRLLRAPNPSFSDEARRKKYSGICVVGLIVDEGGRPRNLRIVRPIGMGLDDKAIEAVSRYEFAPAMKGGQPVPVEINIEVNFRIY
jgi:TonB family protein